MAVPYGTTTTETYTIGRTENVLIELPGFLENHPHDLSGVRWMVGVYSGALPPGLRVDLVPSGDGKNAYISGVANIPSNLRGTLAAVVVASSTVTYDGKPKPVKWVLYFQISEEGAGGAAGGGSGSGGNSGSGGSGSSGSPAGSGSSSVEFDFWAAIDLARAGQRIRMTSWADRWLEYEAPAKWFMVTVNPITRVVLDRHIVRMAPESDPAWWTGRWVTV